MTESTSPPPQPDREASLRRARTAAVTSGRPPKDPGAPLNASIQLSSTYLAGGEYPYGREGNETWAAFEEALAELEGGDSSVAFASGLAALNAVIELVPGGGIVVAPSHPYSGTRGRLLELLEIGRVDVRWVDMSDAQAIDAALPGAALALLESPTNPMLEVCDLRRALAAARAAGVMTAVDNTFATPLGQRPLALGADLVVHSATKYLSGHSDVLMGAVVTADADLALALRSRRQMLGAIPGPFEAWLALRGLRTLAVRFERAESNAMELARRLDRHPAVQRVRYLGLPDDPGHDLTQQQGSSFGAIICIEVNDGPTAEAVASSTQLWVHATSLGGVESLIERRSRWSLEHPDVPDGLLRLSVGIEDVDDLWADLDHALNTSAG